MAEWFYGSEGQQFGPLEESTLKARVDSGELSSDILVWKEGMSEWLPLAKVPEFSGGQRTSSVYAAPNVDPTPTAGYQPSHEKPTSGLAIASLVCGIVGLVTCCFSGLLAIPAIICGHLALKQISDPQQARQGHGLAVAGLVCGYIGLVMQIVWVIIFTTSNEFSNEFQRSYKEEFEREMERYEEEQNAPEGVEKASEITE